MENLNATTFTADAWGKIVDETRKNFGLDINVMCSEIGMSASTYTKLEKGKTFV